MIKIILADDHCLVRTGLKRLLDDVENLTVIGEAENGLDAISLVNEHQPDVVILDINMPKLNGLETTERLHRDSPEIKVLIISMHCDEVFPQRLLNAGAHGYLTKDCGIQEITHAITEVMASRTYICNEVSRKLALVNMGCSRESPFVNLSKRELQVLSLMLKGLKLNGISEQLSLSPKTISTYRYRLFAKLEVQNDMELAKLAMQHGFVEETPLP